MVGVPTGLSKGFGEKEKPDDSERAGAARDVNAVHAPRTEASPWDCGRRRLRRRGDPAGQTGREARFLSVFAPRSRRTRRAQGAGRQSRSQFPGRGAPVGPREARPAGPGSGAFLHSPRVSADSHALAGSPAQGRSPAPTSEHASPHACPRGMRPGAVGSATAEKGSLRAGHPGGAACSPTERVAGQRVPARPQDRVTLSGAAAATALVLVLLVPWPRGLF